MTTRELLQMALEALGQVKTFSHTTPQGRAITAIRTHLAKPEPEPVVWMYYEHPDHEAVFGHPDGYHPNDATPLYTKEQL